MHILTTKVIKIVKSHFPPSVGWPAVLSSASSPPPPPALFTMENNLNLSLCVLLGNYVTYTLFSNHVTLPCQPSQQKQHISPIHSLLARTICTICTIRTICRWESETQHQQNAPIVENLLCKTKHNMTRQVESSVWKAWKRKAHVLPGVCMPRASVHALVQVCLQVCVILRMKPADTVLSSLLLYYVYITFILLRVVLCYPCPTAVQWTVFAKWEILHSTKVCSVDWSATERYGLFLLYRAEASANNV